MNTYYILYTKPYSMQLKVTCSFFPSQDKQADLIIHSYVDDILDKLMNKLNIDIPKPVPPL